MRQRERERQTDRHRERRETEREREERQTEREREKRDTHRETERYRQTDRHTCHCVIPGSRRLHTHQLAKDRKLQDGRSSPVNTPPSFSDFRINIHLDHTHKAVNIHFSKLANSPPKKCLVF